MLDMWVCEFFLFFFKQKTAYELRISDWSSDVCSSDLTVATYEGIAKQWRNGNGGRVYGAEAALSLPFATFSGALDGFGVLASGSYTKSRSEERRVGKECVST